MKLLLNKAPNVAQTEAASQVIDSDWQLLQDEEQPPGGAAVAVNLGRYRTDPELWDRRQEQWTVVIQPEDEVIELPSEILSKPQILIAFPVYTDGRGYSHASTLRQHHGYKGQLVAVGDVRRDQLEFMRQTGFDAYEIVGKDSVEEMMESLTELEMPSHRLYSGAAL